MLDVIKTLNKGESCRVDVPQGTSLESMRNKIGRISRDVGKRYKTRYKFASRVLEVSCVEVIDEK